MTSKKTEQLKFIFDNKKVELFKNIIKDLSVIGEIIKIKIDKDDLFIYSIDSAGTDSSMGNSSTMACKSYKFPTKGFFKFEEDLDEISIDWIIKNGKTFVKKFNFFKDPQKPIKGIFTVRKNSNLENNLLCYNSTFEDHRYKFSLSGTEFNKIRDITKNQLDDILDPSLSDFSITVNTEDFTESKRAADIDTDEKIITILMKNKRIYFSQSTWELLVGSTESDENKEISFKKSYLKTINPREEEITFYVYPTFVLYKDDYQNFMISFEQTY